MTKSLFSDLSGKTITHIHHNTLTKKPKITLIFSTGERLQLFFKNPHKNIQGDYTDLLNTRLLILRVEHHYEAYSNTLTHTLFFGTVNGSWKITHNAFFSYEYTPAHKKNLVFDAKRTKEKTRSFSLEYCNDRARSRTHQSA